MLQKMQMFRGVGVAAAVAITAALSGCGHDNTTATNYAPIALYEFGQTDFTGVSPNQNLGTPGNNTLGSSPGNAATNGTLFYIADTNNSRILGFNNAPTATAGTADFVIGQPSFTTSTPTSGATGLAFPTKVSISGNQLIVVDSGNNRVLIWNSLPSGTGSLNTAPSIVIGQTSSTPTASSLNNPTGAMLVTVAGVPTLVVADRGNNRVLIYNNISTGAAASQVLGQRNFTSNTANCPASTVVVPDCTAASQVTFDSMYSPVDVWSDGFRLLVSDNGNNRVLFWNPFPTQVQTPAAFVIGQANGLTSAAAVGPTSLRSPYGVWSDENRIYVADSGNNRVVAFYFPTSNGTPATAVWGQGDYTHSTADDDDQNNVTDLNAQGQVTATDRVLNGPLGMATTPNYVYIVDSNNSRLMIYSN
jgi:hypothetical protein